MRRLAALSAAVVLTITSTATAAAETTADTDADAVSVNIQLDGARDHADLIHDADGLRYIIHRHDGVDERLTPDELAARQRRQGQSRGWLKILFNVSSPAGVLWVSLGLFGQLLFTGRMIVQWLVSEKSRRSVVPPLFWWLSLIGATMLLAYFLWRRDLVGVIGQAFGWLIYLRNIHLIHFGPRNTGSIPVAASDALRADVTPSTGMTP
jgi:lipid-A-disaccharide synthase-like uncharacterized protein